MKHLHTQISRPLVMSIGPVGKGAVILGAANTLGFAISATTGVHYHLDLIGTGAFAVAAAATRGSGLTQGLSAAAVSIWSVKLASFLFYRVLQTKRDARLEGILSTTSGAFGFWAISFLWGWVVSLPHTVAAGVPLAVRPAFGPLHVAGIALFASGLTVETAADVQKWLFKQDPANKGLFCDVGLWKLSQHPNWVGNLLLWTGVLVLNAPTLLAPVTGQSPIRRWLRFGSAALGPLFLFTLFSGQATDKIGNAVELMVKRYGADERFRDWLANTPILLPTIASIKKVLSGN